MCNLTSIDRSWCAPTAPKMPSPRCCVAFWLQLVWLSTECHALLRVAKMTEQTYTTSKYKYYGSEGSQYFNGSAIWVHPDELCASSNGHDVLKDVVVITVRAQATCSMEEIYEKLNFERASGLLELVLWNPPDFLSSRHHTWNPCAFCGPEDMPMIAVSDPLGSLWELGNNGLNHSTAFVQVEPPHNSEHESVHYSIEWLVLLRIMAPLFAFWTAGVASLELGKDLKRTGFKWNVRAVIFAIEIPCVALAGISLALGTFGPTVMPLKYHSVAITLFNGGSVFTTMLFVLFLREEDHHLKTRQPRRSIWGVYRLQIIALALFFSMWDMLLLFFNILENDNVDTTVVEVAFSATFVLSIPLQFSIAVFFLAKAFRFRAQIYIYLQIRDTQISSRVPSCSVVKLARVGRLFFWLAVGAVCLLVYGACAIILIGALMSPSTNKTPINVDGLFAAIVMLSFLRIGISSTKVGRPFFEI